MDVYGKPLDTPERKLMQFVASEMEPKLFVKHKNDFTFRMITQIRKPKDKYKYRPKKKYLTKQMRRENNLDKLPKNDWNYNALQEMRNMWHSYMTKCLASLHLASEKVPDVTDNKYAQFHSVLAKSELTGANITVEKSNNPSYVGMEGTIVLETQQTFQIVTPKNQLKILLKSGSVFIFHVGSMQFTIYGNSLLIRPHERCVKKIKSFINIDL